MKQWTINPHIHTLYYVIQIFKSCYQINFCSSFHQMLKLVHMTTTITLKQDQHTYIYIYNFNSENIPCSIPF